MKVKDLKQRKILVKYGPLSDPEKFSEDLLSWFKGQVYNGTYPFEETEIRFTPHLSPVPYSTTDRATMPAHYQCMGSLTVWFSDPQGNRSPFSFVDFWHTEKHYHHNTWIYWRDSNWVEGSSDELEGHGEIGITDDMKVSLWIGDEEVYKGVIPGEKEFQEFFYLYKLIRSAQQ